MSRRRRIPRLGLRRRPGARTEIEIMMMKCKNDFGDRVDEIIFDFLTNHRRDEGSFTFLRFTVVYYRLRRKDR